MNLIEKYSPKLLTLTNKTDENIFYSGNTNNLKQKEAEKNFLALFGLTTSRIKQALCIGIKSELMTKEDIAKILVDNGLVSDLEEALNDTKVLLNTTVPVVPDRSERYYKFVEYANRSWQTKYKFVLSNSQNELDMKSFWFFWYDDKKI